MMANLRKTISEMKRKLLASELQQIAKMIDTSDANAEATLAAIVEKKTKLGEIESKYLIEKARRWGIEVPHKQEWYETDTIHDPSSGLTTFRRSQRRLNELGKAVVTKQIRNERFSYWKGWGELLIPVLALIVAVLALFKDIIIEVLKKK